MNNVYERVRVYYEDVNIWQPIVKREWVEGFLRQNAWQGAQEKALIGIWRIITGFLQYIDDAGYEDIQDIGIEDIGEAIQWMSNNVKGFKVNKKNINNSLKVILEFFNFLANKNHIEDFPDFEIEIKFGSDKDNFNNNIFQEHTSNNLEPLIPEDTFRTVGEVVERLIGRIGSYFQNANFNDDFNRSLFLYSGPDNKFEDSDDEFWIGFWDYFLFDYHLLDDNEAPVRHFYKKQNNMLAKNEQQVLSELMNAKFVVFHIVKVLNDQWVECINLFTDEKFKIPYPDINYHMIKKVLFWGHVFERDTLTVNYVNTIEVSSILRKRIKDEIEKLKAVFVIQEPELNWESFVQLHALPVRHAIEVLTTQAIVNIIPAINTDEFIPKTMQLAGYRDDVTVLIEQSMFEYRYSVNDISIAKRLWADYYRFTKNIIIRKPILWAAAVISVYSQINAPSGLTHEEIVNSFNVTEKSLTQKRNLLFEKLSLRKYDPRYLSDEGCVFFLYSQ